MKTKLNLFQARMFCAVALGMDSPFSLAVAAEDPAGPVPAKTSIPWSQIGAKAGADYQGDGLAVSAIPQSGSARLRCVFQRLEGEATREGLWLTSTVTNGVSERFRVVAADVRRLTSTRKLKTETVNEFQSLLTSAATRHGGLPRTGAVSLDSQTVRFTRPGLVEEYSVSMDGVRQDFVVLERPAGPGELALWLDVSGARVEPAAGGARPVRYPQQIEEAEHESSLSHGARLVLENSGRKIAYSRLRATDATGKELTARMKVMEDSESQRDSIAQPRVASPRATLGSRQERGDNPERVASDAPPRCDERCDATPLGLEINSRSTPRVARRTRNRELTDAIPSGSFASTTEWQAKTRSDDRAAMLLVLVNDAEAVYPVRIDPTFSDANWSSMGGFPGADGAVSAAVVDGSGNLYIGGGFTVFGDVIASSIAKWDGSSWTALGSGMGGGNGYPSVSALAVSGSDLYAGGNFTTAGGSAANGIAKWDGSSWSALGLGLGAIGVSPSVSALAVSGSDVYVGGTFFHTGGSTAIIAKWDGSSWSALGSGMDGADLNALAVSGSDLYAGGDFGIAKWNGSSWTALGSGLNGGDVNALAVSGSNVYAGGTFTTAGDSAANGIAKWNGSSWSALGSGMDAPVRALAVSGSDLYAGGDFTWAGDSAANFIAKWDGSSWSALGSGMGGGGVSALAVSGSDLYAGGAFTTAGGKVSAYIARAYLLTLPTLSVLRSGIPQSGITVSWPSADTASFVLEQAGTLAPPPSWVTNTASITDDGTNKTVTLPATNSAQFFRLRRP